MNLTTEDIVKILKLIEESNFDSLQLEYDDFNLMISKSGHAPGQLLAGESVLTAVSVASTSGSAMEKVFEQISAQKSLPGPKALEIKAAEEEDLDAIKAPMVGIFYCAPEPGAKPFVNVGSKVDRDTNVGFIEVMKVFSGVAAGVKGEIIKCLVEDSQLVEHGQPIFLVRPDERK